MDPGSFASHLEQPVGFVVAAAADGTVDAHYAVVYLAIHLSGAVVHLLGAL